MSLKYLLDTNIISEATRLEPNVNLTQKLSEHQREVGTATVVIHELLYGCWRLAILRTVFGTILQALQGKDHKKVELNASQGWS